MNARQGAAAFAASIALVLAGTGTANAAPPAAGTCSGGDVQGDFSTLTITGACQVPAGATLAVTRDLRVAPGAMFDAMTDSQVDIGGNVYAGPGSLFGLGCTTAHPCDDGNPPAGDGPFTSTSDTVGGNVILDHVFDAALNGDRIGGNVVSSGGGAGLLDPETSFVPFSIKDDVVKGNITVTDLTTVWFGVIRTTVGGNVILKNIRLSDPDGNEVTTDTIAGNLICEGNEPANQLGDALGEPVNGPDTVGKHAIGQCAGLTG